MTCRFIIPILYLLVGLSIVAITSARTQILQGTKSTKDNSGRPAPLYKFLLLNAILLSSAVLLWPVFLPSWFGRQRVLPDLLIDKLALEKKALPVRIVHVDDEDFILKMVEVLIRTRFDNVAIQSFHDSNEAWQELSHTDPDILITDDKMPGLTGEDLVRRLGERKAQYPIIVTSGWPPTEGWVRRHGDMNLNISLLRCPFTSEQLYKQLYRHLPPLASKPEGEPQEAMLMPVDALKWNLITKYGSVKEAEAANMVTDARLGDAPVPFGFYNDAWNQLLSTMQDGDELWTFATSEESWEHLAGRAGVSLVRDGEIVRFVVTEMN